MLGSKFGRLAIAALSVALLGSVVVPAQADDPLGPYVAQFFSVSGMVAGSAEPIAPTPLAGDPSLVAALRLSPVLGSSDNIDAAVADGDVTVTVNPMTSYRWSWGDPASYQELVDSGEELLVSGLWVPDPTSDDGLRLVATSVSNGHYGGDVTFDEVLRSELVGMQTTCEDSPEYYPMACGQAVSIGPSAPGATLTTEVSCVWASYGSYVTGTWSLVDIDGSTIGGTVSGNLDGLSADSSVDLGTNSATGKYSGLAGHGFLSYNGVTGACATEAPVQPVLALFLNQT